jgi:hypothetical protein
VTAAISYQLVTHLATLSTTPSGFLDVQPTILMSQTLVTVATGCAAVTLLVVQEILKCLAHL